VLAGLSDVNQNNSNDWGSRVGISSEKEALVIDKVSIDVKHGLGVFLGGFPAMVRDSGYAMLSRYFRPRLYPLSERFVGSGKKRMK